ncbi:L-aminoadipate-semialdehyde dehydrogenase-phosphopantetheinyl transferase [Phytophthora palmivora]|uniref:holo-[acyl-carrier-protein] synthase n=1 Tax=Phytophthora palmivora TaxID=4796 RepID=A0A2P4XKX7_9STRA|nr:L-aminoadipate-semialdehyde dehydrogenase-phosphopantetheinyl transferase [Phytophthora palmivora]
MASPSLSCLRFVDVSAWDPSSLQWRQLLLQLPEHEQKQVTRFMFAKDQNLALGSRLLQRQLIHELFGVNYDSIEIARTPENKPYWKRSESSTPSSWNYNVSHHGTIVAIASDSRSLVGVDVVRLTDRPHRKTSIEDFFRAFAGHFNPNEWKYIRGEGSVDDDGQYTRFYRLWSLKEAYIKATGIGLGFSLLRAEFVRKASTWELLLDGQQASDWHFSSNQVDKEHLVSIAYGPFSAVWKPETSSIFQGELITNILSTTIIDGTEDWQEWRLQDLLH